MSPAIKRAMLHRITAAVGEDSSQHPHNPCRRDKVVEACAEWLASDQPPATQDVFAIPHAVRTAAAFRRSFWPFCMRGRRDKMLHWRPGHFVAAGGAPRRPAARRDTGTRTCATLKAPTAPNHNQHACPPDWLQHSVRCGAGRPSLSTGWLRAALVRPHGAAGGPADAPAGPILAERTG